MVRIHYRGRLSQYDTVHRHCNHDLNDGERMRAPYLNMSAQDKISNRGVYRGF